MPAPAIQTIPGSSSGTQCGSAGDNHYPGRTFLLCKLTTCPFLASHHMSVSNLVEMIWEGKRAQSQMLCFSKLPVARAHSSCALTTKALGSVTIPAISLSLQHCIQGKHCHQAKWAKWCLEPLPSLVPLLHVWEERTILPTRKSWRCKEIGGF